MLLTSCTRTDSYETCSSVALGCVDSKNSYLIGDLEKFEKFLVVENYLTDTTKAAYLEFISSLTKGEIDFKQDLLNEYIWNGDTTNWKHLSQSKISVLSECIFESQNKTNNTDYYEWANKILMKTIEDEFRNGKLNTVSVGVKKETFEFSEIPDHLFSNDLIHYCFLMSLYQRVAG